MQYCAFSLAHFKRDAIYKVGSEAVREAAGYKNNVDTGIGFLQPLRQPFPLCLNPRMWVFRADDAAKVLVGEVFQSQINKVSLYIDPCFLL